MDEFFEWQMMNSSVLPKDVFRNDFSGRADAACVIGAADAELLRQRIDAGIALFREQRVPRLLLLGDGRRKHAEGRSEADRMRESAVQGGVPENCLQLFDEHDDLVAAAKDLGRRFKSEPGLKDVRRLVLVSSAWHLLRLFVLMRRHLPNSCAIFCCPATQGITGVTWQTSPQARAVVDNELRLIDKLLKTGYSLK